MYKSLLSKRMVYTARRNFAVAQKLQKAELTIRTPYRTIFNDFSAYSRLYVGTIDGLMAIGNKTNPRVYLLPPGEMTVKGIEKGEGNHAEDDSGEFMHTGGWLFVHENNSIEISLVECAEKADFNFDKVTQPDGLETESAAGKVAAQLQTKTFKNIQRKR